MRGLTLMSFTMASNLAVASASSLPIMLREVSPDMTCGSTGAGTAGYTCETGMCCSQYGYCGNTTDYCSSSNGCQAAFGDACIDDDGSGDTGEDRCGPSFNNAVCASTECCSAEGYCGTTVDHCKAPDCLFNYGPACDANKIPSGTNTSTLTRSKLGSIAYGGAGIYSCETAGTVAITYDDGPSGYTSDLLDLLAKYNAKATFFITGNNNGKGEIDNASLAWPAVIQRQHADGHQIASHTWSHADLSNITSLQRKNEMIKNEMALRNILGFIPTYMRPPYSSCTAESGCESDLADLGYHVVYFDLDTQDYLHDSPDLIQTSKDIVDQFFDGHVASDFDALAIGHDIHYQTVYNLTEYMLKEIQSLNYTALTVGECLGDPVENWYRVDSSTSVISSRVSSTASATSSAKTSSTATSAVASTLSSVLTTTTRAASSSTLVSPTTTTARASSTTTTASAPTTTSTNNNSSSSG
ncbi:hypothetical protein PFICI_00864 [Pestalotiopsis fici W106-1]|uniref:Chitin deacetylase n=1 Tax=Pestalotiopsis fici (strain W106-1 / CGMCC3.15140) TaxID=1229662 RepID=W3XP28_PESFW|nr:uncharacterized protein PFICI_00864 [Pestalotiopsis fici W106-1]ETS87036.1 hypothetical protein PFICI_00864 [Pestalotiopsis fici W106-1]